MFELLALSGLILQVCGFAVPFLGCYGFTLIERTVSGDAVVLALIGYLGGGVALGALLYGIGGVFRAVSVMANNSQRSADALEALMQTRRKRESTVSGN